VRTLAAACAKALQSATDYGISQVQVEVGSTLRAYSLARKVTVECSLIYYSKKVITYKTSE